MKVLTELEQLVSMKAEVYESIEHLMSEESRYHDMALKEEGRFFGSKEKAILYKFYSQKLQKIRGQLWQYHGSIENRINAVKTTQ